MIYITVGIFLNRWGHTNQIAVFCHMIINLYKSFMTIIIFSNAKGFQNNKYNMILVCQLGSFTDYIYNLFYL